MNVKYYNKTRSPKNYVLRDGSTLYIPGHSWSEPVVAALDGSESLRRGERAQEIIRRLVPDTDPATR